MSAQEQELRLLLIGGQRNALHPLLRLTLGPAQSDGPLGACVVAVRWGCSKWLWVKNMYTKWNAGKWKHGPKPAVPWWFNFDPYPSKVSRGIPEHGRNFLFISSCSNGSTGDSRGFEGDPKVLYFGVHKQQDVQILSSQRNARGTGKTGTLRGISQIHPFIGFLVHHLQGSAKRRAPPPKLEVVLFVALYCNRPQKALAL